MAIACYIGTHRDSRGLMNADHHWSTVYRHRKEENVERKQRKRIFTKLYLGSTQEGIPLDPTVCPNIIVNGIRKVNESIKRLLNKQKKKLSWGLKERACIKKNTTVPNILKKQSYRGQQNIPSTLPSCRKRQGPRVHPNSNRVVRSTPFFHHHTFNWTQSTLDSTTRQLAEEFGDANVWLLWGPCTPQIPHSCRTKGDNCHGLFEGEDYQSGP